LFTTVIVDLAMAVATTAVIVLIITLAVVPG
jgi:hypothetical protein